MWTTHQSFFSLAFQCVWCLSCSPVLAGYLGHGSFCQKSWLPLSQNNPLWSLSFGAGTEKGTIETQPRVSWKCLHPGFLFNKLKRKPRFLFWTHYTVVNFIFVLPLSTKLSTSDPSCLLEMTERERGVGTHSNMDIMEQRMVLSEKFHLSLWGEGRRGSLLHKQRMCLHSLYANTWHAFGERKTKHFPQVWITLEVYITLLQKCAHWCGSTHTRRYSFGNHFMY